MLIHASCVARDGHGLLMVGPSGSGKSDLALRLLDHGFELVADDQVLLDGGVARAVPSLAGRLEVRGRGLVRWPTHGAVNVTLVLDLGEAPERLPSPRRSSIVPHAPLLAFDARSASAPRRAILAFDCARGRAALAAGAFERSASP